MQRGRERKKSERVSLAHESSQQDGRTDGSRTKHARVSTADRQQDIELETGEIMEEHEPPKSPQIKQAEQEDVEAHACVRRERVVLLQKVTWSMGKTGTTIYNSVSRDQPETSRQTSPGKEDPASS